MSARKPLIGPVSKESTATQANEWNFKHFLMISPSISAGLVALLLQLISPSAHSAAPQCDAFFANQPMHRLFNRDARVEPGGGQPPKERTLSQIERALTQDTGAISPYLIQPIQLIKMVPAYGTVIDLGGGSGQAMLDLVKAKSMNAVVVNHEEVDRKWDEEDLHMLAYKATIEQKIGWAEEILPEYKGKASLVIDVRGAFTKTGLKLEFLQTVYDTLIKSGVPNEVGQLSQNGVALLTYDAAATPVTIETAEGPLDLAKYLVEKYPSVFSVHHSASAALASKGTPAYERISSGQEMRDTLVIRMERQPGVESLSFPVELAEVSFESLASGAKIHPKTRYTGR